MAIPKPDSKYNAVGRSVNCYFCNEFIQENVLQGHLMQCGAVLDPCPKKCGVYVQRNRKNKHLAECSQSPKVPNLTSLPRPARPRSTYDTLERGLSKRGDISVQQKYLDNEVDALKIALESEKQARVEIQKQLQILHSLHIQYMQNNKKFHSMLEQLKYNYQEEAEKRKLLVQNTQIELDQIYGHFKLFDEWKKGVECDFQQVKYQLQENNNKITDVQYELKDHGNHLISLDQLKTDNDKLQLKLENEQIKWQCEFMSLSEKYNKFQDFFQEENAMVGALWGDHTKDIKDLNESLAAQATVLSEIKAKYHTLKFETINVEKIGSSALDKVECQSKEIENLRKYIEQLKQDFDLTASVISNNVFDKIIHEGHLLWRINSYKEKLENAKMHDVILNSPTFYSKQHGYKIRLKVFLNGIGKWKGRHIITSLQVLKGDWDPLLTWPCNIEAKVTIKDQTSQGKDYVKYINAKRQTADEETEDPHESSSQYIFIPHATIEKQNFVQNNIIFFEVKVTNENFT